MRVIRRTILALVSYVTAVLCGPAWALTITNPQSGEQVMPGQTVWLIIQPDSTDETDVRTVQVLMSGASGCENVQPTVPIQCSLTIPDGSGKPSVPVAVDIRVMVTFANGTVRSLSTHVAVAATAGIEAFMALRGDPRENPLVFDSVSQQKDLTVLGESADGTTRDLRGRSQGTIYEVSNPAVVKVRDDGRTVAQGIGTATITVRNGPLFFDVPVIVRGAAKAGP